MATKRSSLRACQLTAKRPHHEEEDKQENKQHKQSQSPIAATPEASDEDEDWWKAYLVADSAKGGKGRVARQKQLVDRLLREREEDKINKENALKRKLQETDSE